MFYRVDYLVVVLVTGFAVGALFSKATANIAAARLARVYYAIIAALLVLRTIGFAWSVIAPHSGYANTAMALVGDLLGVLFGAAFGLATRRRDSRDLLSERSILDAFCLAIAFTFPMAGIGKAFSMSAMTDFFTQSGYSIGFLKFITIAEVFGALGLLLPWARIPAWFGLTVDMFGAVLTHVHNGDPVNDSTGAIGMLIRLSVVAVLFELQRHQAERPIRVSRAILRVALATTLCLCMAFVGAMAMRQRRASTPSASRTTTKPGQCIG
jgi:hypothetical protein